MGTPPGKPERSAGPRLSRAGDRRKEPASPAATVPAPFDALYRDMPLAYDSLDAEGRVLDVNQAWLDLLGYAREEVLGRWIGEFFAPHLVQELREKWPLVMASGIIDGVAVSLRRKDGALVDVRVQGRVAYGADGEALRTHSLTQDLSGQRGLERNRPETQARESARPRRDQHDGRTRILVVDAHPVLREGLSRLLEQEADLEVVATAESPAAALGVLRGGGVDLATVDLALAAGGGLELIRQMRRLHPRVPALVFTMHDDVFHAEQALRAGAGGFVTKYESPATLLEAIRLVRQGRLFIQESMAEPLLRRAMDQPAGGREPALSPREREVLHLLGQGLGSRQVAEQLGISVRTVDTHREHLKRKLGLKDAAALMQFAIRRAGEPTRFS
jgi:PAS domain S-box-containing protein